MMLGPNITDEEINSNHDPSSVGATSKRSRRRPSRFDDEWIEEGYGEPPQKKIKLTTSESYYHDGD